VFPVLTAAVQTQILSFSFFIREVPGDDNEDAHFYVLLIPVLKNSGRYWTGTRKYRKKERAIDCPASQESPVRERATIIFYPGFFFCITSTNSRMVAIWCIRLKSFSFSNSVVFV
jgi:hypothetical protein